MWQLVDTGGRSWNLECTGAVAVVVTHAWRVLVLVAVSASACSAQPVVQPASQPSDPGSAARTEIPSPSVEVILGVRLSPGPGCGPFESVAPVLTVEPTRSPAPASPSAAYAPRGRGLVTIDEGLRFYDGAQTRDIRPPYPIIRSERGHLSADGTRVSAVVSQGDRVFAWSLSLADGREALVLIPARPPAERGVALARWTADGTRVAYRPELERAESELWIADIGGRVTPIVINAERVVGFAWAGRDRLALASATSDGRLPVGPATIWSVTPGEAPVALSRPTLFSAGLFWSPDGSKLAYIALTSDRGPEVRMLDGAGEHVLMTRGDLRPTPSGCTYAQLSELRFFSVEWHPDGSAIAVLGGGTGDSYKFVALRWLDPRPLTVFGLPSNCPLFDARWSRPFAFLNLTGPECGRTTHEGRLFVLSAEDGRLVRELPVGRKNSIFPSLDGEWVATTQDGLTFVPVARPEARTSVPIDRVIQWHCC